MKRGFYTIGSLIILLIAAFIFVLVPIFSGGRTGTRLPPFGSYDGTEIRYEQGSDFANYVANYADYFKNQGIEIDNSNYYYIFNYAFNATVTQLAYKKAVNKSGWKVPQTAVNRAMMPYFTDETGKYSSKMYKLADPQAVADLRKNFESSLTTARFAEDSFGGAASFGKETLYGLKTSETETSFMQNLNSSKRSFNLAVFNMNEYPDSEKAAYGKENSQKFVKYDFSVITCADKSKAQSVANSITSEKITFADAVNEYSQKSYSNSNGKMTSQYHYQLESIVKNPDDLKTIAALAKDEISAPVQTSIGYTIFRADSAAAEPDFNDESTLRTVYNYITTNEFSRIEEYYTSQAEKFAADAKTADFDATCKKYNAKKAVVPAFPLNYGSVSVADKLDTSIEGLSGANTNETFFKTAFSLAKGEISKPVVNGRNILVLQLANETAADTEPTDSDVIADEIRNYDSSAAQTALLSSPKLKNNLSEVFFKYIMTNN